MGNRGERRTPTKSYRITELVGVFLIILLWEQRPTKVSKYCTLVGHYFLITM